jgi:hypothetical protein
LGDFIQLRQKIVDPQPHPDGIANEGPDDRAAGARERQVISKQWAVISISWRRFSPDY